MYKERFDIESVKPYIIETLGKREKIHTLIDSTLEEQKRGIDLIGKTSDGKNIYIEVKIRHKLYDGGNDILLETWSKENQTIGWMGTPYRDGYCNSDYIVYVWKINNDPIFGYIFALNPLRSWWRKQNENAFKMKASQNIGYTTINRVVNIKQIPLDAITHSDIINKKSNNNIGNFDSVDEMFA